MMPSVLTDTQHTWDRKKWLRLPLSSSGYAKVFLQVHVSLLAPRCSGIRFICGHFLTTATINVISILSPSTSSSLPCSFARHPFSISWPLLMASSRICHCSNSHLNITWQKPIIKPLFIKRESPKGQSKKASKRLSLHRWYMNITLNFESLDNGTLLGHYQPIGTQFALSGLCPTGHCFCGLCESFILHPASFTGWRGPPFTGHVGMSSGWFGESSHLSKHKQYVFLKLGLI